MVRRALAIVLLLTAGCPESRDDAAEDLARCNRHEKEGNYQEAIRSCREAVGRDPESPSGKRAEEKLPALQKAEEERGSAKEQARLEQARKGAQSKVDALMACADIEPGHPKFEECKALFERKRREAEAQNPEGGARPRPDCDPKDPLCADLTR